MGYLSDKTSSDTTASVVNNMIAVDTAFSSATLITFTGSITHSFNRLIGPQSSIENHSLIAFSVSIFFIAPSPLYQAFSMICFAGYTVAYLRTSFATASSGVSAHVSMFPAFSNAIPPQIVNPSWMLALVALRASSILSLRLFVSISVCARTYMVDIPSPSLAILFSRFSFSYHSVVKVAVLRDSILLLIFSWSHSHQRMIVSVALMIALDALPTILISDPLSLSFSSITVAPVAIAISCNSSSFFSHTPGAFTTQTFNIPCLFVRIIESRASHSMLFAIRSTFLLPYHSTTFLISVSISEISVSVAFVNIISGFSITASCLVSFVLKSGVTNHLSTTRPFLTLLESPIVDHSSTVIVQLSHISSNASAITFPTSGFWDDIVAICSIWSLVLILVPASINLLTIVFVVFFMCAISLKILISSFMSFIPSLMIASVNTIVDVVQSPASLLVRSATSFIILAPVSSLMSWKIISLATVTPSLVTIGVRPALVNITFLHLGPIVTFTASVTFLIPARIPSLAIFQCVIVLVIRFLA